MLDWESVQWTNRITFSSMQLHSSFPTTTKRKREKKESKPQGSCVSKKLFVVVVIVNYLLSRLSHLLTWPVGRGYRIHWLFLRRGGKPLQRESWIWFKTIWWWGSSDAWALVECGSPLHCHCSQDQSGLGWLHLIESYLWVI